MLQVNFEYEVEVEVPTEAREAASEVKLEEPREHVNKTDKTLLHGATILDRCARSSKKLWGSWSRAANATACASCGLMTEKCTSQDSVLKPLAGDLRPYFTVSSETSLFCEVCLPREFRFPVGAVVGLCTTGLGLKLEGLRAL